MSSVNLSEVLQKAEQHGVDTEGLEFDLEALGVAYRAFKPSSARTAAEIWQRGRGWSLGDRACLALAREVDGVAITTERRWADPALRIAVHVIR